MEKRSKHSAVDIAANSVTLRGKTAATCGTIYDAVFRNERRGTFPGNQTNGQTCAPYRSVLVGLLGLMLASPSFAETPPLAITYQPMVSDGLAAGYIHMMPIAAPVPPIVSGDANSDASRSKIDKVTATLGVGHTS